MVTQKDDPQTMARLLVDGQKGVAERGFVLHIEGFDWNCPQHITPRYTEGEIRERLTPLRNELEALRAENARLRAGKSSA